MVAGNEREMELTRDRARLMSINESLLRELETLHSVHHPALANGYLSAATG